MALKNLFKSKTGKLKSDPRIRWFGKLPTYPDYYSSTADEAWANSRPRPAPNPVTTAGLPRVTSRPSFAS